MASDGTFTIRIRNNGNEARSAVYSEAWPWWVKGWMSEMSVTLDGSAVNRGELHHLSFRFALISDHEPLGASYLVLGEVHDRG